MKWTIKDEALAERLDLALSHLEAGTSRAVWQKRIKEGEIFVNASAVLTPHRTLMLGDVIEYHPLPVREIPLEERAAAIPLDIVSETPDWIVINKTAGLLVPPAVRPVGDRRDGPARLPRAGDREVSARRVRRKPPGSAPGAPRCRAWGL